MNGRSFPCGLLHNNHIGLGSHGDGSDFGGRSLEKGEKRRPELRTSDTELLVCVVYNSHMSSMSSPGDVKAVMRMKMKAGTRKVQAVLEREKIQNWLLATVIFWESEDPPNSEPENTTISFSVNMPLLTN